MSHRRRSAPAALTEFARYLRTETVGGVVLLVAAAIALVLANTPLSSVYTAVRDAELGPHFLHLDLTVGDWAKDGLLAIFFFVAGLELKRELTLGELSQFKAAILPVVAALGGMVVPAAVALAVAWGDPRAGDVWPVPVATDIAFALGVLALVGSGMPSSARVFLLSLAVVDDLGAILLIAILFTSGFNLIAAAVAVALLGLYAYLQHRRVTSAWIYVPLAVAVWVAVHSSGVHATVAGVALALLTRVKKDPYEREAPALRLEHRLQPWSAGLAVPVFAFFAAGVPLDGEAIGQLTSDKVVLAVFAGLVVGKLVGITGAALLAVRLKLAVLPPDLGKRDLVAVAMLGGVGFTVSLLIAELALDPADAELAKAAVLIASAVAALLAAALLTGRGRARRRNAEGTARPASAD
ncbi:Na+/H+ antiporter NhaA [Actinokineospora globicatena]|uniref:Na+/H+ antiporter NhaA n=1 Tax=Actinokineospora globicatena TaxID=103729 RepID=UPI0020A54344|nr:Na+/H+ antiporter NhaA [Actinokineospora globicatena]MCP2300976.1 sodium/proton antiporter, NhaA family (TC 2.A.33.1.1) [Actinokineospora globicatena]GLW77393.1 Na(+)/H(+) antiporter NhaA [Actinokineospora globicatena]GLW84227.1 Na(+)/H(+) antiporter NhaA [Actinokineospora globicatena]